MECRGKQGFVESRDAVVAFFQCFKFMGVEGRDGAFAPHEEGEFLDEGHEWPWSVREELVVIDAFGLSREELVVFLGDKVKVIMFWF